MLHKFTLRSRRLIRKKRKQAHKLADQSGDSFERNFFGKMHKFPRVGRFVIGWIGLFVLLLGCLLVQNQTLSGYYQTRRPVPGGIYSEGINGTFTNANPVYATTPVDKAVSRLVFSGLFKYDDANHLVGDIAKSWSVDAKGTTYTVQLRPGLTWQDGQPLTAADVVFTYKVIQNPDAQSPLLSSWQGITVASSGPQTVTFTLPNPLSSFVDGLTNGIIPQHLLGNVPMVGMRSAGFNTTAPVGSGPFEWKDFEVGNTTAENAEESVALVPFAKYWAGAPKLRSLVIRAFVQQSSLVAAFQKNQLTAMSGLQSIPAGLGKNSLIHSFPLTAATMVFFRTTASQFQDVKVRQALVAAANPTAALAQLGYQTRPVREPLLDGQLGYDKTYAQQTNNATAAAQTLDGDGWLLDAASGYRVKNGQRLGFTLTIPDSDEYDRVAKLLQQQWRQIGVKVELDREDDVSFRATLSNHAYEAVMYGITIGADPDVFVYWDSSQADIRSANRLNLSEYSSAVADDALEAGRTRSGDALRTIKYRAFLQQWQQDAPALGLYQPRYVYISHGPVYGLNEHVINDPADRFYSVGNWMIHTGRVTNN